VTHYILFEIQNLIDAKKKLNDFNNTGQIITIGGSVLSSIFAIVLSPVILAPLTFLGSYIITSYIIKMLNNLRYNKLLNSILFDKHVDFINNYYEKLDSLSDNASKKELSELEVSFSKCATRTTFLQDSDLEHYELRKCYINYLDLKSKMVKLDKNDVDYIYFTKIKSQLLYKK